MRNFSLGAVVLLITAPFCLQETLAQNLILQDGRTVPVSAIRRAGDTLIVPLQIGTSVGDVGYLVNSVIRADFPEPPELAAARIAISQGNAREALGLLTTPMAFFQPISGVPGSWWPDLALARADALHLAGSEKESTILLQHILLTAKDHPAVARARLRLARPLIVQGKFADLEATCAAMLQTHRDNTSLAAETWLLRGDARLAQKQFEAALMAYLRVPTLYFRESTTLPPALLGSARCYLRLKDLPRASETFTEITQNFPSTPEARTAANELLNLAKHKSNP